MDVVSAQGLKEDFQLSQFISDEIHAGWNQIRFWAAPAGVSNDGASTKSDGASTMSHKAMNRCLFLAIILSILSVLLCLHASIVQTDSVLYLLGVSGYTRRNVKPFYSVRMLQINAEKQLPV